MDGAMADPILRVTVPSSAEEKTSDVNNIGEV